MSEMVRRAGRATLDDGTGIVWSVADGRRGRRWRAMTTRGGHLVQALLTEVDTDRRPTRLELTAAAGLLTLHPEPSARLHGNVVTPGGMRHLAFAWSDDHELAIDRFPIAGAITAHRLAATTSVGEARDVEVVTVDEDLDVHEGSRRFSRVTETTWRIDGSDGGDRIREVTIDERGLLVWPGSRGETSGAGEAVEWPLEVDPLI
jgi:hypothetical protein